jgi:hypothetical protein
MAALAVGVRVALPLRGGVLAPRAIGRASLRSVQSRGPRTPGSGAAAAHADVASLDRAGLLAGRVVEVRLARRASATARRRSTTRSVRSPLTFAAMPAQATPVDLVFSVVLGSLGRPPLTAEGVCRRRRRDTRATPRAGPRQASSWDYSSLTAPGLLQPRRRRDCFRRKAALWRRVLGWRRRGLSGWSAECWTKPDAELSPPSGGSANPQVLT